MMLPADTMVSLVLSFLVKDTDMDIRSVKMNNTNNIGKSYSSRLIILCVANDKSLFVLSFAAPDFGR